MSFPNFSTGGGGATATATAATGPARSGDIGGSIFEGINTGTRSAVPGWVYPVALAIAAIVAIVYLRRK